MPEISVVIPLYNEAETLEELHRQLKEVLEEQRRSYEILFVDDGSTDQSPEILARLTESDERVGVVAFRRNFGKAAALDAGFKQARGHTIITMDADLQDDPSEIPQFIAKLEAGFDLVNGWRKLRRDPWHKLLPSKIFNKMVVVLSGIRLRDFNCGFKACRAEALKDIDLYGELHRFIPVLVFSRGFRVTEIPVRHHPRRSGKSKYGLARLPKGFFDLMTVLLNTRYRTRPLHLFGFAGLLLSGLGFLVLSYLTVLWFMGVRPIGNRPLLFLGLLLMVVGVQLISTGLLGELINRAQQGDTPNYVIQSVSRPAFTAEETETGHSIAGAGSSEDK